MDLISVLAAPQADPADAFRAVEADDMPRPAALAMPRQPWKAKAGPWTRSPLADGHGRPATSPARIGLRRVVFFSATIALTAATMVVPWQLYRRDNFSPLEVAGVNVLMILLLALSCWFCNAVAGLIVLAKDGANTLDLPDTPPAPQARTALLMPLYNEDAHAAIGRLGAIESCLAAHGASRHFDLFVLSDSRDPEALAGERSAFRALRRQSDSQVFYRVRTENHERKVGNISDWIRRHGGAYDYFVVLDADSTMSGGSLLKLVDAMERMPGVGLIQTAPTIVGGTTLFARASQFAVRLYGRVAAAGLSWWAGSEASYWGHNAIVRTRAFAASAGLSPLDGGRLFGGEILSHDVVEAALLRRNGWAVHLAPTLDGSHEETPPGLMDFMRRERRWCQGNLQHLALMGVPGLHWVSRLQFVMGAMAYLASPLWLASLLVGLAIQLQGYTDWSAFYYILTPHITPLLWGSAMSALLLMGPKLLGLTLVLSRREERAAFGGTWPLLKSAALEVVLSSVTAPLLMVSNTRMVIFAIIGKDAGWSTQRRTACRLTVREAIREHRAETLVGVALSIALAFRPDVAILFLPIVLPLLFAGPLAALISRADVGEAAKRRRLMATPEELADARLTDPKVALLNVPVAAE